MDMPEVTSGALPKAERRGLADEAAGLIRAAIFAGLFPPGAPLREVELARSLDISRGSVREGLSVLAREGLVHSAWHRGTNVIDVTPEEVEEVYTVRAALERLAVRLAAERATEEQTAELAGVVDQLAAELERGADGPRLLALDLGFHDRVYELAGNRRLRDAWRGLRSQVQLFQLTRVRLGHDQYRAVLLEEHRELVRLIRERDVGTLERVAEEHVLSAYRMLSRQLAEPTTGDASR
jgi:DNA-binding GntR family transcriptional regulator